MGGLKAARVRRRIFEQAERGNDAVSNRPNTYVDRARMKKTLLCTAALTLLMATLGIFAMVVLLVLHASHLDDRWTAFKSINRVCEKWGEQPLDVTAFKSASDDEAVRAAMACSLIRNQKDYIGLEHGQIRQLFGSPDGFYVSDYYFAYIIESGRSTEEDSWQIVFLTGRRGNVSEIVVHKNCC